MKIQEKERMYTSKINHYEHEIETLQEQIHMQSSAENNLTEYKKRAQTAIKKSNDQLSELNLEMEKLKFRLTEEEEKYQLLKVEMDQKQRHSHELEIEIKSIKYVDISYY